MAVNPYTIVLLLAIPTPHEVTGATLIIPPFVAGVTVILFVVDVPVQPEGNVHTYDVAPVTAVILYVIGVVLQTLVKPVIGPAKLQAPSCVK